MKVKMLVFMPPLMSAKFGSNRFTLFVVLSRETYKYLSIYKYTLPYCTAGVIIITFGLSLKKN